MESSPENSSWRRRDVTRIIIGFVIGIGGITATLLQDGSSNRLSRVEEGIMIAAAFALMQAEPPLERMAYAEEPWNKTENP